MRELFLVVGLSGLMLAGCSTAPKTPVEFRSAAAAGTGPYAYESFTVDRSSQDVIKTFRDRASECLNTTVVRETEWNQRMGLKATTTDIIWRATVNAKDGGGELVVRTEVVGDNVLLLQESPEGGFYSFIADVASSGAGSSKIDAYFHDGADNELLNAVKKWADGTGKRCPDLRKYAQ